MSERIGRSRLSKRASGLAPLGLAALLTATLVPAPGWTAPPAAAPRSLSLPASAGQHPLRVQLIAPHVIASACAAQSECPASRRVQFPLAPEALARINQASLRLRTLHFGRRVVELSIPGAATGERWVMLLAASLESEDAKVLKLLSGWLGRPRGIPGERHQAVLLHEPARGRERLVVGRQYEHASVCGRPATIRARELDPATMQWRWTSARSLTDAQRTAAVALPVRRQDTSWPEQAPKLLQATVASSAAGRNAGFLTDGLLDTAWSEARPGAGLGEFVVMSASSAVPVSGFRFVVRPTRDPGPTAIGPRQFWLATSNQIYEISLPSDPWADPAGTSYAAALPRPTRTDCVALVLGTAFEQPDRQQTTIAELRAQTAWDSAADWAPLVQALEGPTDAAQAAAALLSRGGSTAIRSTVAGFEKLGEVGRLRALEVLRSGDCPDVVDFYVAQLLRPPTRAGRDRTVLVAHARELLRGCGPQAAAALRRTLDPLRLSLEAGRAAQELALIDPAQAVDAITEVIHRASDAQRRQLRAALSTAAGLRRARRALRAQLAPQRFAGRPLVTRIDLLRAVGPTLASLPEAGAALKQVVTTDRSFRTRYLIQLPAGYIASGGDAHALELIAKSLEADPSPHVRARAARAASKLPALASVLGRALRDGAPRVRQGALRALAGGAVPIKPTAERTVVAALRADPWTFVREAAAEALSGQPLRKSAEMALQDALREESPRVRRSALMTLGRRGSPAAARSVREVADQAKEATSVRIAAINALGTMCDVESVELLTKLAQRAAAARLPYDRPLGLAALVALRKIHPSDLRERLAPMLHPRAPFGVRQLARAALRDGGSCR